MTVPGPAEIHRYAQEILRRPEFNPAIEQPHAPGWLQRILEWLLTHRIHPQVNVNVGTILLIVVGAALALLLASWLRRFLASGGFAVLRRNTTTPAPQASARARPASARDSLRMAGVALAAGDARGAIQALLRACLDHLGSLGAITLERWKTNTVYLGECPSSLPSYPVFRDVATAHNDIVYAHRSIGTERIGAMMDALARQIGTT
jgi:hypothetical protein